MVFGIPYSTHDLESSKCQYFKLYDTADILYLGVYNK